MTILNLSPREAELSQAAKTLMDNPAYRKAFEEVADTYMKQWASTKPSQTEERELIYTAYKLVQMVKSHIENRVSAGSAYLKSMDINKEIKRGLK